ncbi:MAG: glycosyltransferase family 4 protein [Kiritimatiellae bacterium]|nr:glycosyltransferase family 4 protein [Kiritimatiellia bacterium]
MSGEPHNILFDARVLSAEPTGENRYLRTLAAAFLPLLREDEMLHLVLSSGYGESPVPLSPRCRVHRLSANAGSASGRREIVRLSRELRSEVFHTTSLAALGRVHGRAVLTLHDFRPAVRPQFYGFFRRLRWRFHALRAVHRARRCIAVSEEALQNGTRFFGKRVRVIGTVVPPCVSPAFSPQSPECVARVREAYGLPEKFLLYAGADDPVKNLETLLGAYALLEPTETLPLVLAGFPPRESRVRVLAEPLADRIVWCGVVPDADMPALYSAARAFLFPSLDEAFCYPALEAMSCGTPVVCSALNVLKEMTAGVAKIVHPTDRQEWRRAIHSAVVSIDWHDTARAAGLARAAAFRSEEIARETLELYRKLYPKGRTYDQSM